MAKTAVVNHTGGMIIGQLPNSDKTSAGLRSNGAIVVFMTGATLVDSEQLAILRKNPGFEEHFTEKIPPSAAPEQEPHKVGKPRLAILAEGLNDKTPLKGLKPETIQAIIQETLTNEHLDVWLKQVSTKDADTVEWINNQKAHNNGAVAPRGATQPVV